MMLRFVMYFELVANESVVFAFSDVDVDTQVAQVRCFTCPNLRHSCISEIGYWRVCAKIRGIYSSTDAAK